MNDEVTYEVQINGDFHKLSRDKEILKIGPQMAEIGRAQCYLLDLRWTFLRQKHEYFRTALKGCTPNKISFSTHGFLDSRFGLYSPIHLS